MAQDKKLKDNTKVKNAIMKNNVKMRIDKDLAIFEESKFCALFY